MNDSLKSDQSGGKPEPPAQPWLENRLKGTTIPLLDKRADFYGLQPEMLTIR